MNNLVYAVLSLHSTRKLNLVKILFVGMMLSSVSILLIYLQLYVAAVVCYRIKSCY